MRRMSKEPPSVAILSARIMRAYPSLSPYSAASLATELCAIERAQRRHAEAQCNGEYAYNPDPRRVVQNIECGIAEQRAGERIDKRLDRWQSQLAELVASRSPEWDRAPREDKRARMDAVHKGYAIELQDDPRGPVLLLRLPGEAEGSGV